jgi:hypothetical protein
LRDTRISIDVGSIDILLLVDEAGVDLVVRLQILGRVELVGVKGLGVHWRLLVLLGHVGPLGLDIVLGVGALRVLDVVLLRHPVAVGDERADAIEEAVQSVVVSDMVAHWTRHACLPRIVLPVILLCSLAVAELLVPLVPLVDARGEHRHQDDNGHGERDEPRKRHARALDAVCPDGLADLVAP